MPIRKALIPLNLRQRHTENRPKVGEEAVESVIAAMKNDREELVSEVADLAYHLTVLLHNADLSWAEVNAKLKERHKGIGLHPEGSNK